jgi:hypothetical protein
MTLEFCPTLESLYRTREAIGRSGKLFSLTSGLSTVNNLLTIREIMFEIQPEKTLEIGMACGGSTLTFASTHRDLKHSPCGQHVAIDGFQRTGFDDVGRMKLAEASLNEYVDIRERLSSLELPRMDEEGRKFQMIYIDGSHRFEDVFLDFYFVRSLTTVGGYILFDDSSDYEVSKVIRFIRKNLANFFTPIPIAKYRSDSAGRRLKYRLGEAFSKTQLAIFLKTQDGERQGSEHLRRF